MVDDTLQDTQQPPEVQVVEAVMTSANTGGLGGRKSRAAKIVEHAMAQAVQKAFEDGVGGDAEVVRERIDAARKAAARYIEREAEKRAQLPAAEQQDIALPSLEEINSTP